MQILTSFVTSLIMLQPPSSAQIALSLLLQAYHPLQQIV